MHDDDPSPGFDFALGGGTFPRRGTLMPSRLTFFHQHARTQGGLADRTRRILREWRCLAQDAAFTCPCLLLSIVRRNFII